MPKKHFMIKNTKRKIVALLLLPLVAYGFFYVVNRARTNEIYAVDPLVITYDGNNPPDPMFTVINMLPGDVEEKIFNVKNGSAAAISVVMYAVKTDEEKDFSEILDMEITDDSPAVFYSGKLKDFFDSPPINLGGFSPFEDKDYKVKVTFPSDAGDEYQKAKVVFNIIWRIEGPPIELPEECKHMAGKIVNVIEGTEGNDDIRGTVRGDLVLAKGGKDKVDGASGDDCIMGGRGNDKRLDGGSGDDTVIGGAGDDFIDGGAGKDLMHGGDGKDKMDGGPEKDIVYGGDGDDKINGASGTDLLYGESGNDTIEGGSDGDEIYGGAGADNISGSSGNDKIYGEADNDKLYGNSGNDLLDGGSGIDYLRGDVGTDTCSQGEAVISCET